MEVFRLGFNQAVDAVERQAAVVANDTSAGIVVGQTREETERTEAADFFSVNVEYAVVVSLAVVGEDVLHSWIYFLAILCAGFFNHLDAAERLDGTLEEFVGLQTHDEFVLLVDVARFV